MLKTKLNEVLTEKEIREVERYPKNSDIDVNSEIRNLTVDNLSDIAFVLIRSEYGDGIMASGCLPIMALKVIYDRICKNCN
jgi:hypothetical protein